MLVVASFLSPMMVLGNPSTNVATQLKCGPFTTETLPEPMPRRDRQAVEQFQTIKRTVEPGRGSILFLGDSLTEKWNPSVWDRYFATRGAENAGINGDRTEHLLWRLQHGNLYGSAPAAIVLLIGTNDIGRNRLAEIVAEGVRTILAELRARLPAARILLLGILPRSEFSDSLRRRQVDQVNGLIQKCDDRVSIRYVDVGYVLLDAKGRLSRAISPDEVHLESAWLCSTRGRASDIALDEILGTKR